MRSARLFILLLCCYSCANIVAPTGGPKDERGPVVLKYIPENKSIRMNSKKVILEFDEYIALKNTSDILESPRIDPKPEYTLKGKSLEITLPDSMGINTTYTINFGKTVVDITESNPAKNLSFVFSTGDFLDSLRVEGVVIEALSGKGKEDFLVGLYSAKDDPKESKPIYFSFTDADGHFSIQNVKDEPFQIYAFSDVNKDQLISRNEELAFESEPISPGDSAELRLRSFAPVDIKKVKSIKAIDSCTFSLTTSFPLKNPQVALENEINLPLEKTGADSILVYVPRAEDDSLYLFFSDNEFRDTILLDLFDAKAFSGDSVYAIKKNSGVVAVNTFSLKLNSYWKPLKDSVRVLVDNKDSINALWSKSNGSVLEFSFPINSLTQYSLQFEDSCLQNINKTYNRSFMYTFKTKNFNEFGTLILDSVEQYRSMNFIMHLLKEGKLIHENAKWSEGKFRLEFLEPGEYTMLFIVDDNSNHRFDVGNPDLKLQAEKVLYYSDPISIKANWELELSPALLLRKLR